MKTIFKLLIVLILPNLAQAGVVRTIYFYPNDRTPQADIASTLDAKMKTTQNYFAAVLDLYGYTKKTFPLETDTNGDVVVYQVQGDHNDAYYLDNPFFKVVDELMMILLHPTTSIL